MTRAGLPIIALAFLMAAGPAFAESPGEAYNRANAMFAKGDFQEAAKAYEAIGLENPDLEYNLGTTYLKLGRLGKAALHLKRAERLRPGDEDTRANLDYIAQVKTDREEAVEIGFAGRAIGWLLTRGSATGAIYFALGLYLAAWGILIAIVIAKPGSARKRLAAGLAVILPLVFLVSAVAYAKAARLSDRTEAVVMVKEADTLSAPAANSEAAFTLHEATIVRMGRVEGNYVFVTLASGHSGWMDRAALERI